MFNDEIYIQNNGAAIGSSLGPLLANIFMASLVIRYVEDTQA